MSENLRHVIKKRVHLERSQPQNRKKKFGFLEKHKDYALRAKNYAEKKKVIHNLREKSRGRNPDEFYFKMIRSRINEDGKYEKAKPELSIIEKEKQSLTNRRFVEMKLVADLKAVEKSQGSMHASIQNNRSHILFMNEEDPSPLEVMIESSEIVPSNVTVDEMVEATEKLVENYSEIAMRKKRAKELKSVLDNLEAQSSLFKKKSNHQNPRSMHRKR